MESRFNSPNYGDRTQVILNETSPRGERFDPQQAVRFLCELAQESSLVRRLQTCFPEVDPQAPDRPLRHDCPDPQKIAPDTTDEAERKVLQTVKNQRKYLRRLAAARGISLSGSMTDWLSGRADVQLSPSYYQNDINSTRELMYAFCGILGYGEQEITDFFWKVAFQPPFKHKVWTEVVYKYFSSQSFPADQPQNNWYTAAQGFIEEEQLRSKMQQEVSDEDPKIEETLDIERAVRRFSPQDTKELRDYLIANRASFRESNFNVAARQSIQAFYEICLQYVAQVYDDDQYVVHSSDTLPTAQLFSTILGNRVAQEGLSRQWPEAIRKNFPTADLLGRILGKKAKISDSLLRKTLLLLEFYQFYAELRHEKCLTWSGDRYDIAAGFSSYKDSAFDYSGFFDEFLDDADWQLSRCGFHGLYPRNPYDCLFMLAASSAHPLEALPNILENGPTFLNSQPEPS